MTLKELASKVAKIEGNKSQARIGDIREILGILSELFYMGDEGFDESAPLGDMFYKNGQRRLKRKKMI